MRVRRAATRANSAATKNAFVKSSATSASSRRPSDCEADPGIEAGTHPAPTRPPRAPPPRPPPPPDQEPAPGAPAAPAPTVPPGGGEDDPQPRATPHASAGA